NWSTGSTNNPITVSPAVNTTYTVTGTSLGCTGTATATVTITPNAVITVNNPTICAGQTAILTASGASSFQWNTGSTSNPYTIIPVSTTTYTVTGTDAGGCTGSTTAVVTVNPNPTVTANPSTICTGHTATLTASGATNYQWNTGSTTNTITVSPVVTTTYSVTGTTNGCDGIGTGIVQVNPIPTVSAGNDTTIIQGGAAQLTGIGGVTYVWSPATGLSCTNCASPTATPTMTTTYTLTVTDSNGCFAIDSVVVIVDVICGDVFVPNSFTPNGDNLNELVCVYGNCVEEILFSIYDRWGEKAFETTDPKKVCWDGRYRGTEMNTAVFVYYLRVRLINGETVEKKGNITLFR
ncbi:MAG: gliding motility-associated C-terminal domain-containing protein, partial [Bacteroidota bacterium]